MPTPTSSEGAGTFTGGTITSLLQHNNSTQPQEKFYNDAGTVEFAEFDLAAGRFALYVDPSGAGGPAIRLWETGAVFYDESFRQLLKLSGQDVTLGRGDTVIVRREGSSSYFVIQQQSAPADATLNNGDVSLWFDSAAPGALKVKAKDSGGTVRSATIALA